MLKNINVKQSVLNDFLAHPKFLRMSYIRPEPGFIGVVDKLIIFNDECHSPGPGVHLVGGHPRDKCRVGALDFGSLHHHGEPTLLHGFIHVARILAETM